MSPELAAAYAEVDWAQGPLGDPDDWSPTLWATVEMMLATRFAVTLIWGPERVLVYNDAYVPVIGAKHPDALGRPVAEVFPEAWDTIGPMLDTAEGGTATWVQDAYLPLVRQGFLEECYFTFSYSAVRAPTGEVEGVIDITVESTQQVISRRRLELLSRLGYLLHDVKDREAIVAAALPALEAATEDFLAVDLRLPGEPGTRRTGLPVEAPKGTGWTSDVYDADERGIVAWLPVSPQYAEEPMLLVARPSDQLPWDQTYGRFLRLVAATLAVALERVRVIEAERMQHHVETTAMRALQEKLLPRLSGGDVEVAVRYLPAIELAHLGGDWYDAFALPDGAAVLVMGDIMGHDEHAAAAMAEARNVLRGVAFSLEQPTPASVLAGVDRALHASDSAVMATVLVMQLRDADDGRTTVLVVERRPSAGGRRERFGGAVPGRGDPRPGPRRRPDHRPRGPRAPRRARSDAGPVHRRARRALRGGARGRVAPAHGDAPGERAPDGRAGGRAGGRRHRRPHRRHRAARPARLATLPFAGRGRQAAPATRP